MLTNGGWQWNIVGFTLVDADDSHVDPCCQSDGNLLMDGWSQPHRGWLIE